MQSPRREYAMSRDDPVTDSVMLARMDEKLDSLAEDMKGLRKSHDNQDAFTRGLELRTVALETHITTLDQRLVSALTDRRELEEMIRRLRIDVDYPKEDRHLSQAELVAYRKRDSEDSAVALERHKITVGSRIQARIILGAAVASPIITILGTHFLR